MKALASISHALAEGGLAAFEAAGTGCVRVTVADLGGSGELESDCCLRSVTIVDSGIPAVAERLATGGLDSDCFVLLQTNVTLSNYGSGRWQGLVRTSGVGEVQEALIRGGSSLQSRLGACVAAAAAVPTDPAFQQLIKTFRARLSQRAAELRRAVDASEAAAVQEFCHRLKGTAASYGLPALGLDGGEVESMCKAGVDWSTLRFPGFWLVGQMVAELAQ